MFSQLGPLFRTYLRTAEPADARLEIRRDEKQKQEKKEQEDTEDNNGSVLWDDTTTVSVEALKAFLIEFLKSRNEALLPQEQMADASVYGSLTPESRAPASARAARAVKAYTALSETPPPAPPSPPAVEDVNLVDLLQADEVRTMHILIAELNGFSRRGVQTLVIEKADTFLEALVRAVELEKSGNP